MRECIQKRLSTLLIILLREVVQVSFFVFVAHIAGLESVRMHHIKLLEYGLARRTILARIEVEATVPQSEGLIFLATNERQDSNKCVVDASILNIIVVSAAIEEAASFPVVAMQVAKQFDTVAQSHDLQHLHRVEDRRVQHPIRAVPLAI